MQNENLTPVQQRIIALRSALRGIADQLCDVSLASMHPVDGSEKQGLDETINPGKVCHVDTAVKYALEGLVNQFDVLDLMVGHLAVETGLPYVFGPYAIVRHDERHQATLKAAQQAPVFAGADAAEFGMDFRRQADDATVLHSTRDMPTCPKCQSEKLLAIKTRPGRTLTQCEDCGNQVTLFNPAPFKSPLPTRQPDDCGGDLAAEYPDPTATERQGVAS